MATTPAMQSMSFTLYDRLVLVPGELVLFLKDELSLNLLGDTIFDATYRQQARSTRIRGRYGR